MDDIVVVGSRVRGVAAEDLSVPVDVHDAQELGRAHSEDLAVTLQKTAPSFNSKRNALGDGGLFHTATLRGMSPDHTLLLVNGKRRHSISFPRPLDAAGQGTTGADLRTIPLAAIERIEVLRDGAATQYGSDAIGGVINIVLKETPYDSTLHLKSGITDEGDGQQVGASVGIGLPLGAEGSINVTTEFFDQDRIDRAFETGALDPQGPNPPGVRRKSVLGEPEHDLKSLFVNAVARLDTGGELYAFGGLSSRNGKSSGAWRDPVWASDRMVAPVHPDGFLPFEVSVSEDQAISIGFRSRLGNWNYDASASHGVNEFDFGATDSINASWAASWLKRELESRDLSEITPREVALNAGPRSGDSGGTRLSHYLLDFDISGPIGDTSEAALGAEFRDERFRMRAGDEASWICGTPDHPGDEAPAVTLVDGAVGQADSLARCGHQGYPGYSPTNARFGARDRSSHALWADLRHDVSLNWNVEGAARYERHDGAGDSLTGMVGSRYRVGPELSFRTTASTGFRAPSLPQLGFNTIVFGGGDAEEGGLSVTAHLEDGAAREFFGFGPETLGHEDSRSLSAGLAWKPKTGLSLSADVYLVDLEDRITLVKRTPDCNGMHQDQCDKLLAERQLPRITDIQFFDNAVDTRTTGLDIVARHNREFAGGDLTLTGALHFNRTKITAADDGVSDPTRSFIEYGNPRQRYRVHASWTDRDLIDLDVGVHYFGKAAPQWLSFGPECPGEISPAWITDASVGFRVGDDVRITVGASNLLDEYPDEVGTACKETLNATLGWGIRYNPDTSYGLSGRIWYTRLDIAF